MKGNEFERWLKSQGATIVSGKGSHKKVTLNGKTTIFPYHGSKEIREGTRRAILKQLGLKP